MNLASNQSWVLGIDGGGTHTRAFLADLSGRIVHQAKSGPLNWNTSGWTRSRSSLRTVIQKLGITPTFKKRLIHTVIGCAALNDHATAMELRKLTDKILPVESTTVISDGEAAWFGAGLGKPGVLAISGTGSIVFAGRQRSGLTHVGGWGPMLGDEGSARWMALHLLRCCLGSQEGTLPPVSARLSACVRRHIGITKWNQLWERLYGDPQVVESMGELSAAIDRELPQDPHWREICRHAGQSLAWQTFVAAQRAQLIPCDELVPCWIQGSVLTHNRKVQRTFQNALRSARIQMARPQLHPSLGPLALAFEKAGIQLHPHSPILAKLQKSMPQS